MELEPNRTSTAVPSGPRWSWPWMYFLMWTSCLRVTVVHCMVVVHSNCENADASIRLWNGTVQHPVQKLTKGNVTTPEFWKRREGEFSGGTIPHQLQEDCQLQTSTELSTGRNQLQNLLGKDVHCISYKKSTISTTQPMRNCHYLKHCLSPMGLSFKTAPPNFLLLLHKIKCSSPCCLLDLPIVLL